MLRTAGLVALGLAAAALSAVPAGPTGGAPGVPVPYRPWFAAAAARFGVPAPLLEAVAEVESGFDPAAVGPPTRYGRAEGLMQFLPSSWPLFNVVAGATPFEPRPAILAAAHHLAYSGATPTGFDPARALYGYNHSSAYVALVLRVAAGYGYHPPGGVT
ncbi:MAG TPA: transglycosylase SLT domain-containing protein [Mycobacteriales bacterium]|nr:transglycosylase SLT domain-containing protein [Mycobacteriales bacterium]